MKMTKGAERDQGKDIHLPSLLEWTWQFCSVCGRAISDDPDSLPAIFGILTVSTAVSINCLFLTTLDSLPADSHVLDSGV